MLELGGIQLLEPGRCLHDVLKSAVMTSAPRKAQFPAGTREKEGHFIEFREICGLSWGAGGVVGMGNAWR